MVDVVANNKHVPYEWEHFPHEGVTIHLIGEALDEKDQSHLLLPVICIVDINGKLEGLEGFVASGVNGFFKLLVLKRSVPHNVHCTLLGWSKEKKRQQPCGGS